MTDFEASRDGLLAFIERAAWIALGGVLLMIVLMLIDAGLHG